MASPLFHKCYPAACAGIDTISPSPQAPARPERRRSPRQTLVARAVLRADGNPCPVATGFISNISLLGVGFHTRRPLAVGEAYVMHIEVGPMTWSTRVRVVSCNLHGGGTWDVGAEFAGADAPARTPLAA